MKGFMDMMKQAQTLQAKMQEMQAELARMEIAGEAGAGMVRLVIDGQGALKRISIDPSLLKAEESEILEDLIIAAHADAKGRLEKAAGEKMQSLAGGLPLPPGLKPF
jgi:DNA-binding YbaB/EbfC family protein